MRKLFKKAISFLLVAVMTFGVAPLNGFVGLELSEIGSLKKLVDSVSDFFDGFTTKAEAAIYSGKCGDNLTWTLDRSTGVLSIDGTGDMYDYEHYRNEAPWADYDYNVHSLIIGENVTSIGAYAFYGCEINSTITISKNINKIGERAFTANPIESFSVSPNNLVYSSDSSGVLYNKDKTVLIQYPIANPRTSFSIPNGVITIESHSFGDGWTSSGDGTELIENVTIPDTVKTIKHRAFYSCQRLKSVSLGNSLSSIGEEAFSHCTSLLEISIPDNVETIESHAFSYCDSLSEVFIGKSAIKNEDGDVLELHLIFRDCLIKSYTVSNEHPFLYSSEGVVFSKFEERNELIAYPLGNPREFYAVPEGTTDINSMAFYDFYQNENCKLKSIKLPSTIADLGSGQLECLYCLEEIIVDNSHPTLLSEDGVLYSKDKTDLMLYPKNKSGNSYTVPDSVNSISSCAFEDAIHLYDISIPESVRYIGRNAFYKCGYYNNVNNWQDDVLYIDQWLVDVKKSKTGSLEIREGTVHSSFWAFYYCENITELTIPSSFEDDDFYGCDNVETLFFNAANFKGRIYYSDFESLKTVYIGDTVEQLGTSVWDDVFQDITTLESVVFLPTDSLKKFNFFIFKGCVNLKTIILPDSVEEVHLNFNIINNCSVVHIPSTAKITGMGSYSGITSDKSVHICSEADLVDSRSKEWLLNYYSFKVCDGSHSIPMFGKVTGIDIAQTKIQMSVTAMLMEATVYPETAENKDIMWTSSNPDVADFNGNDGVLTAKANGYTVVTATTIDGSFTDSCLVFVGKNTMVVSSEDGNDIIKGDTHKVYVSLVDLDCISLSDSGVVEIESISDDPIDKTIFAVADSSVATIKSISEWSHNGRILEIKGVSPGTTYITMTNNDTGEVKYLPIYVQPKENTYTTETIPATDEGHRGIKNFRHNGIYIYDYLYLNNDDGSVRVSFTAYNNNTNNGSIEVYNENGTIVKSYMLEAHNGGDPTSVDENCEMIGAILASWVNLDPYDPTNMISSTKTEVDCTVPKNGYIKITNDVTESKICLVYNIMDLVVSTVSLSGDIAGFVDLDSETTKKVVEKTSEKVIDAIIDTSGSAIGKIIGKIIDELSKPETKENRENLFDLVEQLLDILDLKFEEILVESIWDVTKNEITDLGLDALGTYGKIVKGLYAYNTFLQLYNLIEESNDSIGSYSAYIYARQDSNKKVSNGIVFKGDADSETVFRTYAIAYGDIYVEMSTLYGAEDMELYDISLVKDGNTVQPSEKVQVSIPIPNDWNKDKIKVYRVTVDGIYMNYEDMKGKVNGDYVVFETDHFSYYAIVDETEVKVSIASPSITTVSYGDSIVLHADLSEALPDGWSIKWEASNGNFSYTVSEDGKTCTITPNNSGDTTFTATVYDAQGNEVSKDEQTMTSKAGFFDKIVAFFKKLFGLTKTIPQIYNGIF